MSTGLIALLDDIAGIAKVAAASVDDIATQAAKAGAKAAGVVIDDAAVTPRYVIGFKPDRELPIVWKIARGSIVNKLAILLPAALALDAFAPWLVTPLLMLGGAFLCYEGAEKVYEVFFPHAAHQHQAAVQPADPVELENAKVSSAVKTDFILSAEIMAITLSAIPEGTFVSKTAVLAVVAIGITIAVYGAVALIVKADDAGLRLAAHDGKGAVGAMLRAFGRALVRAVPPFLKLLAIVGTAAMVWVGGGIIVHGLEGYGFPQIGHLIHGIAIKAGNAAPALHGAVEWIVNAAGAGVVGLALGALLIPVVGYGIGPAWRMIRGQKTQAAQA